MKYAIQGLALIVALINLDILIKENVNNVIYKPATKNIIFETKRTTCISRWNGVETVASTSFQRGIHVVYFVDRSRVRTL